MTAWLALSLTMWWLVGRQLDILLKGCLLDGGMGIEVGVVAMLEEGVERTFSF